MTARVAFGDRVARLRRLVRTIERRHLNSRRARRARRSSRPAVKLIVKLIVKPCRATAGRRTRSTGQRSKVRSRAIAARRRCHVRTRARAVRQRAFARRPPCYACAGCSPASMISADGAHGLEACAELTSLCPGPGPPPKWCSITIL